jgi:uncharacterized membrane protein YoaK (UPF0700 family)
MKLNLPALLSLNAGYVDTAGYLALQGLFTAHVTGNFVTFGASIVFGTSGAVAKLLALPVFCVVVMLTKILSTMLERRERPALRTMLVLKLVLLIAGASLAIRLGPFADGDAWPALLTGMVLVSAMAIQNAVHRIHLGSAPPTTLMTGTTTQIMIDLADMMQGSPPETRTAARARLRRMVVSVVSFAVGCLLAAFLYGTVQVWCFLFPALLAAVTAWPWASVEI